MGVDVLWAESRRRYLMALSAFERERLGGLPRVEVEEAEGLPPAICFGRTWGRDSRVGALLQVEVPLAQGFGWTWPNTGVPIAEGFVGLIALKRRQPRQYQILATPVVYYWRPWI